MLGNIHIAVNFFLLVLNRKDDFPDIQKVLIFLKRRYKNAIVMPFDFVSNILY